MSFSFDAADRPFPRWFGPFSPARGTKSGFRFSGGRLGTHVSEGDVSGFWVMQRTAGVRAIEKLVLGTYQGGRVLLLPNGCVIKPLQGDSERGKRAFLGEFNGDVVLEKPEGGTFSFENPGRLNPGDRWPGPTTTGLECQIKSNGSLDCSWYHPTELGRDDETHTMAGPDPALAKGFRLARPGEQSGRVRVTAKGHVITNRQVRGQWHCHYVGRIDIDEWPHLEEWID